MEKHRSILRGQFTKKANLLEALLMAEKSSPVIIEIKATYKGLIDIKEKIEELDEEIKNKILVEEDDNIIEKEFDEIDKYTSRWCLLVEKYNFTLNENIIKSENNEDKHKLQLTRLPKINIVKFDGNIINWLPFWEQFRKIHENDNMDVEDKCIYLLQSITPNTEARNLVESYPMNGENYLKCIDHLKSRYAREDLLIQSYIQELLSLVLQRADGEDLDLATLYDKVSAYLRALETLGATKNRVAFILPIVESALPQEILKAWQRTGAHDNKMEDELCDLLKFLQKEVECEQQIKIASTTFCQKAPDLKIENMSSSTAEIMATFEENSKYNEDDTYEVKLPFKIGNEDLLPNYETTKVKLYSSKNKLISNDKFEEYHECFQEWQSLGIIEEVPPIDIKRDTGHYLTQRAVIKESSLKGSLRPVFDAAFDVSEKYKNGLSFDSSLGKSFHFMFLISNLRRRFKIGAIGIIADIQKAFIRIGLPPNHRNYTKILWWENDSLNIKKYIVMILYSEFTFI